MAATLPSEHMQPLTANNVAAVTLYDAALWEYTGLRGDPVGKLTEALKLDPTLVGAHIMNAALHLLSTAVGADHPVVVTSCKAIQEAVDAGLVTDRERRLASAIEALGAGLWRLAAAILEQQLAHSPCDLLTVRMAHDIYFFLGDSHNLRDGVARVWPAWDPTMAGYGRLAGMLAFGHEECGAYAQAEEMAMTAVNMDPTDAWAIHAAVHVYEMQGRREEGKRLMKELEEHWKAANLFDAHLHWHSALFGLEDGGIGYRAAVGAYTSALGTPDRVQPLALDDATALLWRLELLSARYEVPIAYEGRGEGQGSVVGTMTLRLHPELGHDCSPPHMDVAVSALPQAARATQAAVHSQRAAKQAADQDKAAGQASSGGFFSSLFGGSGSAGSSDKGSTESAAQARPPSPSAGLPSPALWPSRWEEAADRWQPYLQLDKQAVNENTSPDSAPAPAHRLNVFNDWHMIMSLAWAARAARGRATHLKSRAMAGKADGEEAGVAAEAASTAAMKHESAVEGLLSSLRYEAELSSRQGAAPVGGLPASALTGRLLGLYTTPFPQPNAALLAEVSASQGRGRAPSGAGSLGATSSISLSSWAAHDNMAINGAVGAGVAEALAAFVAKDYNVALQLLLKTRSRWHLAGGSHAQRDLLEQTLLHAAVGAGCLRTALALARERVTVRANSGQSWYLMGSLFDWAAAIAKHLEQTNAGQDNSGWGILQAVSAPGRAGGRVSSAELYARATDAKNRAYVLGINQGPGY